MRNINGLIAFCTLTLLIGSCKKDTEQVTPINNNTVLTGDSILYRIKKNSILISEYTYNANHTVKTAKSYTDSGDLELTSSFSYNTLGKLIKTNNEFSNTANNTYDSYFYNTDNLLTSIQSYQGTQLVFSTLIDYDASKRVSDFLFYSGCMYFGTNYIYNNTNNIVKEYDSDDLVKDTTYYTYDNKKTIRIKGTPKLDVYSLSVNNIIQYIHKDIDGNIKPSDSYNAVFEYNSNNLPHKETRTYYDGTVSIYEYEFY